MSKEFLNAEHVSFRALQDVNGIQGLDKKAPDKTTSRTI